jgi:hypothetical protein
MAHANCMLDTQGCNHILTIYVIFIAFPLQKWLQERPPLLRYSPLSVLFLLRLFSIIGRFEVLFEQVYGRYLSLFLRFHIY